VAAAPEGSGRRRRSSSRASLAKSSDDERFVDPARRPGRPASRRRRALVRRANHRQTRIRRRLAARGAALSHLLPYLIKTARHARRTREVKTAAFPGYLFVAIDTRRDRWRSVNGTIGVSRLVAGGDGAPAAVPYGVVETLFGYLDETGACRFDRDLVVGQRVRVIAGPLAEAIGRLVRLDARGRVQVLLEILGGRVPVTLERSVLEAA
jgi:transcriptional antiterminator RfaH